jgi:hypothetical protein
MKIYGLTVTQPWAFGFALGKRVRRLHPDGLAILVTKDPIRQNRRYPFALLCITIMQALDFFLADWWRRDCIPTLFTNLKRQNNPEACKVDQEDVLIFSRYSRAVC